jgi:hypothetical protein
MVMIATQDELGLVQDATHACAGLRPVTDHVAEADEDVMRVRQDRFKGLYVAVHIGDNEDFHKFCLPSDGPL